MAKKSNQGIEFHYLYGAFYFPRRKELKKFLLSLFRQEGQEVEHVNYIFCTDKCLHQINRKFLQHDTYTDIVTFPLSEPGAPITAEIYISVDRVKENAKIFKSVFTDELHRVIIHGALHLCGYRDKTKAQIKEMREQEAYYLTKYKVPRRTVSRRNLSR